MGKILTIYKDGIDKAWYNSSNIVYSECIDHKDMLKEVKITFKNGNEYTYFDVSVQDYLFFREDSSQGKALNRFIKKYKFEKSENKKDLEKLAKELNNLLTIAKENIKEDE